MLIEILRDIKILEDNKSELMDLKHGFYQTLGYKNKKNKYIEIEYHDGYRLANYGQVLSYDELINDIDYITTFDGREW